MMNVYLLESIKSFPFFSPFSSSKQTPTCRTPSPILSTVNSLLFKFVLTSIEDPVHALQLFGNQVWRDDWKSVSKVSSRSHRPAPRLARAHHMQISVSVLVHLHHGHACLPTTTIMIASRRVNGTGIAGRWRTQRAPHKTNPLSTSSP